MALITAFRLMAAGPMERQLLCTVVCAATPSDGQTESMKRDLRAKGGGFFFLKVLQQSRFVLIHNITKLVASRPGCLSAPT